jgi:hypothetical protein
MSIRTYSFVGLVLGSLLMLGGLAAPVQASNGTQDRSGWTRGTDLSQRDYGKTISQTQLISRTLPPPWVRPVYPPWVRPITPIYPPWIRPVRPIYPPWIQPIYPPMPLPYR